MDTSDVRSLGDKALALERKGHFARSVEKYDAAIAAAQALGQPDCLVVVTLQLACVNALTYIANGGRVEGAAAVCKAFELQDAAVETVRRRLAAGTLLQGRCRPYEVAYYDALTRSVANDGGTPRSAAGQAECVSPARCAPAPHAFSVLTRACSPHGGRWATLVGFDNLLHCASNVLQTVFMNQDESDDEQQRQRCALVVAALDAITVRSNPAAAAAAEAAGRENMLITARQSTLIGRFIEFHEEALEPDTPSGAALAAAWVRLKETFLLDAFGGSLDEHAASVQRTAASREAKRAAASTASQRRSCAHSSCGAKEAHPGLYKKCSACSTVVYCCKEHQVADWPQHKAACKAARKATASAAVKTP